MTQSGYYRFPTLQENKIVFVCEDDLWKVTLEDKIALRLTNNLGEVTRPVLSPDGKWLAFTGTDEGNTEIYCMPADGGVAKRLTFLGTFSRVVGWSSDGESIIFATNGNQPFARSFCLFQVSCQGGAPEALLYGPANGISYGPSGGVVLGRNMGDPARWKRYRGGTAGVLWVDPKGDGNFQKLLDLKGNLSSPMWIGERIYFISDHENIGALYSCTPQGEDLKKHTENEEFYIRNASSDGKKIVYHAGGELYIFDPEKGESTHLEIQFCSGQIQRKRKFVKSGRYLEDYSLHPDGHSLLITSRGKSFHIENWERGVNQIGTPQGVRYRLTEWLQDGKRAVTMSDEGGEEALEIYDMEKEERIDRLDKLNIGRPLDLKVSPTEDKLVLCNHRNELFLVDLKSREALLLDKSRFHRVGGFDWSPDGKWVTYSLSENQQTFSIKICHIEKREPRLLTPSRFRDFLPSFDPEGRYIYFLSYREFNPVYDSMYFDLNFPKGIKPFLISLQKDTPSPFLAEPKAPKDEKKEEEKDKEDSTPQEVQIDFDGIEQRIAAFPVQEGRYTQIWGLKKKVLFSSIPVEGSLGGNWFSEEPVGKATLESYSFEDQKTETLVTEVTDFRISLKSETLAYRSGNRIRVTEVSTEAGKKQRETTPNRETGWIDLSRIKIAVEPDREWAQMYREIWRLQRDHFWDPDMCGMDWEKVYGRYQPLLEKITTRSEFSDLIWEMQGELGSSHAYELGGDYRKPPQYHQGFLGADFEYDEAHQGYKITHIVRGDFWDDGASSPLLGLGVGLKEGDIILSIDGQKLEEHTSPQELLVHKSGQKVNLTVLFPDGNRKKVTVRTLGSEFRARYREWVEANRKRVKEATKGRAGYIHIPDMGPQGYAEFHRYYLTEVAKEALIVDVRYNGGGHVSQLILEKLARKRIGYDISRWGVPDPYPSESVLGPMVAITNEHAGSDGDIFSHCFKLMKLGTLIGKRTWGGVIGIWPRHHLVDGSITTQPEFSFWFEDVGWGVENYGTDPHIEVDITPQDCSEGRDPQMDKALSIILDKLEKEPPTIPDFSQRPRLEIP